MDLPDGVAVVTGASLNVLPAVPWQHDPAFCGAYSATMAAARATG
jgi:hypothetical protein